MATQNQQNIGGNVGKTNYSGNQNTNKYEPYDQAVQKTGEVIDQVQEKVGEVADQVQEKVGEVADQVKEQATTQIVSQKEQLAEGLGNAAQLVRMASHQLRQNNQGMFAEYTDKAAQSVEGASQFLRERDLTEIAGEVESFARREPLLFLGGAFTLGLLAARFLKSSAPTQSTNGNTRALALRPDSTVQTLSRTGSNSTNTRRPANQNYGDYPAQASGSTVARHFGEDTAAGHSAVRSTTNPADSMSSDVDQL